MSHSSVHPAPGPAAAPDGTRARGLCLRWLGECDYVPLWQRMQRFTAQRSAADDDEIWFLSHPPVFTQGQAGRAEHLLDPGDIPVVPIDRGGQVTYHGPGQLVVYLLIDLRRAGMGIRDLVSGMESAIITTLSAWGIRGVAREGAPGVYVDDAKIASLGLRVRRGCSYHGLSLNVSMDLAPFSRINPCGYQGLAVTRLRDHVSGLSDAELMARSADRLEEALLAELPAYDRMSHRRTAPAVDAG